MDMLLKDVPFKDMGLWQFDFRADEDVVWVAEIVVSDDGVDRVLGAIEHE